jgi:hypothetical protein
MSKARIRLIAIGHMPPRVNFSRIQGWRSGLFELAGPVDHYALRCDSDGPSWEYSDELLKQQLPTNGADDCDFTVAIVNVPIQDDWYSRRLGDNEIVFTFHQIREILAIENIPLENALLRLLYSYTLVYIGNGSRIPDYDESVSFTHDETRGCLFDMNGTKGDIVESCHQPILCSECEERLTIGRVPSRLISTTKKEINRIRKPNYYMMLDFVKTNPLWALLISSGYAVLLGVISTYLSKYIENDGNQPPKQGILSSWADQGGRGLE